MSARFPGRRFSWFRLTVLALCITLAGFGAWLAVGQWQDAAVAQAVGKPWFAGYVDVTATPTYAFEAATGEGTRNVVLSFVVAGADKKCLPTWGASYSLEQASADLDLDRRIARLRERGREVIVSFGGLLNDELAVDCGSSADLAKAYRSVIDRYSLATIDLDLEGPALTDPASGTRRAEAVAQLQREYRQAGRSLAVWLTLPVATSGLTQDGTDTVARFLTAGVDLAGVNAMTMDFGGSLATGQSMADGSIAALTSTHRQLGILYEQAGTKLGTKSLWRKLGATPMLGQNDVRGEVFTLADARAVNSFALRNELGRVSVWSLNRDQTCGVNYPDPARVSDSCSGIDQGIERFAAILASGFTASPDQAASAVTTPEPTTSASDNPLTSPYPIWLEKSSYPAGTKVVWGGNVYQSKWWTQGDLPDDPVLQESATPWRLVGPVLPNESPSPAPTLPADFYPKWKGDVEYQAGSRVMNGGLAFEARWWNTATSPESSLVDPGGSPWAALSQDEIRRLLAKR